MAGHTNGALGSLARAFVVVALGLLALFAWDSSQQPAPLRVAGALQPARLAVFLVDSLDLRDVQQGMPRLRAWSHGATRGPAEACFDAITVPCVAAMLMGRDRPSPLSPFRNFGGARSLVDDSLLGALRDRGVFVGYFGEAATAAALRGSSRVQVLPDDAEVLRVGLVELAKRPSAFVLMHLTALDDAAHKFTIHDARYLRVREKLDAQLAAAIQTLAPNAHAVVLGDHGHAPSGRHLAGLGRHTFAALSGPRFPDVREQTMAVQDHARAWAAAFGLTVSGEAAEATRTWQGRTWGALRSPLRYLPLLALAFAWLGAPVLRTPYVAITLVPPALSLGGGPRLPLLCAAAWLLSRLSEAPARAAAAIALCISLALVETGPELSFPVYSSLVSALGPLVPIALGLAAVAPLERRALLATCAGIILAALRDVLPAGSFALPCALALPTVLLALVWPSLRWTAALAVPPALWFFVQGDAAQLAPLCAVWLLWSLAAPLLAGRSDALVGMSLVLVVWSSFWSFMGTRLAGVDFDFYFTLLGPRAEVESGLVWQALLTCAKYLLPGAFACLLACPAGAGSFGYGERWICVRIAVTTCFLLLASLLDTSAVMRAEVAQELLFWLLALLALGLASIAARVPQRTAAMLRPRQWMGLPRSASSAERSDTSANTSVNSG